MNEQVENELFELRETETQVQRWISGHAFRRRRVNVPESHVVGSEVSATWEPIDGLVFSPSISYAKSEIDGDFRNFDPFFNPVSNNATKAFSGEPFPNAPKWQSNVASAVSVAAFAVT